MQRMYSLRKNKFALYGNVAVISYMVVVIGLFCLFVFFKNGSNCNDGGGWGVEGREKKMLTMKLVLYR